MSDTLTAYPDTLEIRPLKGVVNAAVHVPGSKSITNRALVLAALASHSEDCYVRQALHSEDTEIMLAALTALGFRVDRDSGVASVRIGRPHGEGPIPARQADLFLGNSGTSMRFLTALVSLGHGRYRLDGVARMRERPIGDLLSTLQQLDVQATSETGNGCPPVVVQSNGLRGGRASIRGGVSSQFLSGLLMAAPLAAGDITLEVEGRMVSEPYVAMTVAMVRDFGGQVDIEGGRTFVVPGRQHYRPRWYDVEPDASAASYFFAAAAVTGGQVFVPGLTKCSLQGDVHFVGELERMGCRVEHLTSGIVVRGGPLHGIDTDMNAISDTVMTLGAVACFADGPTTIRNVDHIRHKETDRLAALATELRRVGAEVDEFADGLTITPRPLHGAEIETYNDHRMAMSMALIGLRVPGVVIKNPACVAKTYPRFFKDLETLRQLPADG